MAGKEAFFERIEKKYLMNRSQYEQFLKRISPYMKLDEYGDHTVMSVYYDTDRYDLIRRSVEHPYFKEKLRVRSYGTPTEKTEVYIELKRKINRIVYKRRKAMCWDEAAAYLKEGIRPGEEDQIFREIDYFLKQYPTIAPRMLIAYERAAYYSVTGPKIRLTIDRDIRAREDDLTLLHGSYGEKLYEKDIYVVELKIEGSMPLWLSETLADIHAYSGGFSKYGRFYEKKVTGRAECHV